MKIQELQQRLNEIREGRLGEYAETWGCRKETDDPSMLGWITVSRRKVSAVTPVDPQEEPERFARWQELARDVKERPYLVSVYEVNAAAYEAETNGTINYMAPEDYGEGENYYLSSLTELPEILVRFGRTVDDLIPNSELLAP